LHLIWRSLLLWKPGWTDNQLQKLEQWAKKCIELCGGLVATACFLPGQTKDLSAPHYMFHPMDWFPLDIHSSIHPWTYLSTKAWGSFQQNANKKMFQILVCVIISFLFDINIVAESPLLVKQGNLKE
jgi:hypothetical protein